MIETVLLHDRVRVDIRDGIAEVWLARPDRLNAIDPPMFEGLLEALDVITASNVQAVILAGEGKAFCAGLDVSNFQAWSGKGGKSSLPDLRPRVYGAANSAQHVAIGWRQLSIPVFAAI
ncbi:enoyl-CoA hydratase-related protein, partial [Xanthomonas citri pv. citri]